MSFLFLDPAKTFFAFAPENTGCFHSRNGDTDIVALLLQHGADLHLKDDEGKEAIHFAAKYYNIIQRKNKTQVIDFLLNYSLLQVERNDCVVAVDSQD